MKKVMKLVGILTVAAMLMSSMSLSVSADSEDAQLIRSWGFETSAEGWQVGRASDGNETMTNLRVVDGTLRADAIIGNGDPQFVSADLTNENILLGNGEDGKANYIKIRMKNHTDIANEGKVFFMTDGDTNYSSSKSYSFPIAKSHSDFVDIYLKMSNVSGWTGTLKALRIDPVDQYGMDTTKGGTFIIDEISLYAIHEPVSQTIVSQTFDTEYSKETTGGEWWATYLKDTDGTIMARASHKATTLAQSNGALDIIFSKGDERVDVLGFAGVKDTTGTHKISVKIKNNGTGNATVHLNVVGAKKADGSDYAALTNQTVTAGNERVITFERDFYTPTAETNALIIQAANACNITVDDVKIIKEDKLALSPLSQIHEGATDVDVAGAFGLLFNYDVKGGNKQYTHLGLNEGGQANIKICEKDTSATSVTIGYALGQSTYAQFSIPQTTPLKYNTEYKLELEVVNNADYSQTLRNLTVNFKTKEEPKIMGIDSNGVETTVLSKIDKIKFGAAGKGYLATYKDSQLTGVKLINVSDTENTISLSSVAAADADTVMAFLWTDDLTPITNELVLK